MHDNNPASLGEIGACLFWMMIGPALLVVFGVLVIRTGNGWLTVFDFDFLGVLTGMVLARWLEFRGGHAQTDEGEPATPAHLRRYFIGVAVLGFVAWVIANVLGIFEMSS